MLENFLARRKRVRRSHAATGGRRRRRTSTRRDQFTGLLGGPQVEVVALESGAAAIDLLRESPADCVVLTPEPNDMSLATLAEQLSTLPNVEACPMFLYVGPDTADGPGCSG